MTLRNNLLIISFIFLVWIILNSFSVLAIENVTLKDAEDCLKTADLSMRDLVDGSFNIQRINDSIKTGTIILEAQKLLEEKGKKADYSLVLSYCDDVENVKKMAYEARDMLYSLEKTYEEFKVKAEKVGLNISEINNLIADVRQEMKDERYEKAKEKIPGIEKKIIEVEAEATTMNIFYKAVTRGIRQFLAENYIKIIIIFAVLLVLYIIYHVKIKKAIILKKIKKLEVEKDVLKDLIKKTQRDYFQEGKISEGIYNIRTKRFAELIRDLDRQIPLLREELEKLNVKLRNSSFTSEIKDF